MYNKNGDFMKKIFSVLLATILTLSFSSCGKETDIILDNSSNSKFIDFYTEDDSVYIECELNIYAEKNTEVKISAVDFDDVETGLLKSKKLTGINKSNGEDTFTLKAGENTVSVIFKGEYAGVYMISNREIPRFITIEKV